ncbi:unnamed protein product [Calypogeia fissa]
MTHYTIDSIYRLFIPILTLSVPPMPWRRTTGNTGAGGWVRGSPEIYRSITDRPPRKNLDHLALDPSVCLSVRAARVVQAVELDGKEHQTTKQQREPGREKRAGGSKKRAEGTGQRANFSATCAEQAQERVLAAEDPDFRTSGVLLDTETNERARETADAEFSGECHPLRPLCDYKKGGAQGDSLFFLPPTAGLTDIVFRTGFKSGVCADLSQKRPVLGGRAHELDKWAPGSTEREGKDRERAGEEQNKEKRVGPGARGRAATAFPAL